MKENKKMQMKKGLIIILFIFLLIPTVLASDVSIWQGQYYTGTTFHQGTYEFNFSIYDAQVGGGRASPT